MRGKFLGRLLTHRRLNCEPKQKNKTWCCVVRGSDAAWRSRARGEGSGTVPEESVTEQREVLQRSASNLKAQQQAVVEAEREVVQELIHHISEDKDHDQPGHKHAHGDHVKLDALRCTSCKAAD